MEFCLIYAPIPGEVLQLAQLLKRTSNTDRVFCIDTEWVETVDGSHTAIEIAVYDLNGTKIVDDPIDLGISVETLLAGVSRETQ